MIFYPFHSLDFMCRPVVDPLIKHYIELMLQNDIDMMTLSEHQNASIDVYNKNSALGTNRADRFKRFSPLEAFIPTVLLDILEKVMRLTTNCHVVAYDFDYLPPCAEGDLNSPVNCINGPIVCKYDEKGKEGVFEKRRIMVRQLYRLEYILEGQVPM